MYSWESSCYCILNIIKQIAEKSHDILAIEPNLLMRFRVSISTEETKSRVSNSPVSADSKKLPEAEVNEVSALPYARYVIKKKLITSIVEGMIREEPQ
ncbi:hypothetical protein Glove_8g32 [Diversispora epigaea]|uniref:Uncharacterized protein n=1 Tax=Diversispora epigaea TaxID=1348612 RepID=A0A397JXV2_9GLOM|nr:hypothetical protein Glove_8g32 [Diversispora epigaea]